MNERENVVMGSNDDDEELVDVGDNRKLYELDVFEAIEREKHIRRDKDDVARFSIGVVKEVSDEIDSIRNKERYSSEKIVSSTIIHGISLMQFINGDDFSLMYDVQARLIDCDIEFLCDMVSSSNKSTYKIKNYPKRKSVVLPYRVLGAISNVNDVLFSDSGTMYQICMMYSMATRNDMVKRRKANFLKNVELFEDHVKNQCDRFNSAGVLLDTVDFGERKENIKKIKYLSMCKIEID